MNVSTSQDAAFYSSISKIVNFFRRTSQGGFLFCVCNNGELINHINQQIIERARHSDLIITSIYISSTDIDNFLNLVRKATSDKPDGIIINNLDELILISQGAFVQHLNFAREILIELNVPLMFWFSERNISLIANKARDLFIRKDRGIINFIGITGISSLKRLESLYAYDEKGKKQYENVNIKIELLEKQLEEGIKKGYSEKRIATEIAADLIKQYLDVHLIDEAISLFNKYRKYYEESENVKFIKLCAEIYESIYDWDRALEYYLKSEKIIIEVGDRAGLGPTYFNIGTGYQQKGEHEKGAEYIIVASFIAMAMGMRHELSQMSWAIEPILNELGQEHFMEIGKRLYQQRLG